MCVEQSSIDARIVSLRILLEETAKYHQYDLNHPNVLKVSKKLDEYIFSHMKFHSPNS